MLHHQSVKTALQEVQFCELDIRPTGGTFALAYGDEITADIAYDAAPSAIQTALEALPNIEAGDITVSMAEPFSETHFCNFVFTVGKLPLGMLSMDVSGLSATTEAVFTKTEDAPPNSFGQIIGWSQDNQSLIIQKPNDNNLGICKVVFIPDGIPSGKNGVAYTGGIRAITIAAGESISEGDKVRTKRNSWFAKEDSYGMFYVVGIEGNDLHVRICQMWPEIFVGGSAVGTNLRVFNRKAEQIFDRKVCKYGGGAWSLHGIDVDKNGYIYCAGVRTNDKSHWILNPYGEVIWSYDAGTTGYDIKVRDDGCFFLSSGATVYKFNADGNYVWDYNAGGSLHSIALGPSNTVYIVAGTSAYTIIKLTDNGGEIWSKDGLSTRGLYDLAVNNSGDVFVVGASPMSADPEPEASVWKLSGGNGAILTTYHTGRINRGVALDSSGNVYVAGTVEWECEGVPDGTLVKLTSGLGFISDCSKGGQMNTVEIDMYDKILLGGDTTGVKSLWYLNADFSDVDDWPIDTGQRVETIAVRYLEQE